MCVRRATPSYPKTETVKERTLHGSESRIREEIDSVARRELHSRRKQAKRGDEFKMKINRTVLSFSMLLMLLAVSSVRTI